MDKQHGYSIKQGVRKKKKEKIKFFLTLVLRLSLFFYVKNCRNYDDHNICAYLNNP